MKNEMDLFDEKVRRVSQKKGFVSFCPVCSSIQLKPVIYGLGKDAAALSPQMKCMKCGFYGFPVEASPEDLIEFRKELKEKEKQKKEKTK